jgi:hypothetical protein
MTPWIDDLRTQDPCTEGYQWARDNNIASLAEAFAKLERADWWLWLASAFGVELDKPRLVTFAADCAERVLPKFEARYPDDQRPRKAIEAARAWVTCPSPETQQQARAAYAAAYAAYDAAYAADDAAYAAYAAAYAADDAAYAADDAADAAYAAADAAADAAANDAAYAAQRTTVAANDAAYAARPEERHWQANRLRELFPEVVAPSETPTEEVKL